jgi:hypothetical protein
MNVASLVASNAAPRQAGAAVPRLVLPRIVLCGTVLRRIVLRRAVLTGLAAAALLSGAASTAHAQWRVVSLHPAGARHSQANGVCGNQQVGTASFFDGTHWRSHASLWSGTAESWVSLHPAGARGSEARGISGNQQVGSVDSGAALWHGTAESWVDLHPVLADISVATATDGARQVGVAYLDVGATTRAVMWTGTAASLVNLHPRSSMPPSAAYGASGDQQVGVYYSGPSLWRGSAATRVDLHPELWGNGEALATDGVQQAGWVSFLGGRTGAALWRGTAESFVSLHPVREFSSVAQSVSGGVQAGRVHGGGRAGAALWRGTAESWVDLHALLPGGPGAWVHSEATAVWTDGQIVRVAGWGEYLAGNEIRREALLWTGTLPLPTVSGTFGLRGWTSSLTGPPVTIEVRAPGSTRRLQIAMVRLSATGEFTLSTVLPPGTYDVTVKGDRWLRAKLQNVTFTAEGASGLAFGELIPGDVSENNAVDLADYLALAATFDRHPPFDSRADLNGDGAVDLADFLLLAAHYEMVGAP